MAGIFISYRRVDTLAWAGHLFADLRKSFGAVFMDINGGIPRGADFQQELTRALAGCDALLALIGPVWSSCTAPDGSRRRLEVPEDWVRTEIATALRRGIRVVPVLFGGAALPAADELPEEIRGLLAPQRAEVSDSRWDFDVGGLLRDLLLVGPLQSLHDLASADAGIGLLRDLITQNPAVSNAVSLSREVIDNTYRQVARLERFKTLHDALHNIELDCLAPLKAAGAVQRLRPFKMGFAGEVQRMQAAMQGDEVGLLLREDLQDQLEVTAAAFEAGEAGLVVSRLDLLISSFAPQLDLEISNASTQLNLDRLVRLMTQIREILPAAALGTGGRLEELAQGIDALDRLRGELASRVTEHHLLQRLDSKLRSVCVGGPIPGAMAGEWKRIQQARARLAPPFSPQLAAVHADLLDLEAEVTEAVEQGGEAAALDLMREYFREVSKLFRNVDSSLNEFCLRLSAVSQPLKTILELCA